MYNLEINSFTEEDIGIITERYVQFYQNFQSLKTVENYRNIPKIFVTILRIINQDPRLKAKYKCMS